MHAAAPIPPYVLAQRVGELEGGRRAYTAEFDAIGAAARDAIVSHLPAGWDWAGKRVLDFGCGPGRTLRHLVGTGAELVGCDIHAPSIAWLNDSLEVTGFVNEEQPPLAQPSESFDLVYAMSVFSHLADTWSAWLLELHRVLKPGGVLMVSYLGAGMSEAITGEAWDEDRVGMNVLRTRQDWGFGGPSVLLSEWWIRSHWGRAFEIVQVDPGRDSHGLIVATPRLGAWSPADLEALDPDDPREIAALRHNIDQVNRDAAAALATLQGSVSWRVTRPLRAAKAAVTGAYRARND